MGERNPRFFLSTEKLQKCFNRKKQTDIVGHFFYKVVRGISRL